MNRSFLIRAKSGLLFLILPVILLLGLPARLPAGFILTANGAGLSDEFSDTVSYEASFSYGAAGRREASPKAKKRQQITGVSDLTLIVGERIRLRAAAKTMLTYAGNDAQVLRVTKDGVIKALSPGRVKVTIQAASSSRYRRASKKINVTVISQTKASKLRLQKTVNQAWASRPSGNGSWAIQATEVKSGLTAACNNHRMQAASLIKLFIMGAVYEDFDRLSARYGKAVLTSLLSPMIRISSNSAANQLVVLLGSGSAGAGMKRVNSYCKDHGYKNTSMGRLLLQSRVTGDNYTSVKDCCHFLTQVALSASGSDEKASMPYARQMQSLLLGQTRRSKIPAGLPAGIKAANKTGELYNVENDAAILYRRDGTPWLVLTVMSENLASPPGARSYIARAAGLICKGLS